MAEHSVIEFVPEQDAAVSDPVRTPLVEVDARESLVYMVEIGSREHGTETLLHVVVGLCVL